MNRTGVVIVDDQAIFRGGVRSALDEDPALLVLGETAGEGNAIDRIVQAQPDVVVIGLNPPTYLGLEVLSALRKRMQRTALIALALQPGEEGRDAAETAGANAYTGKDVSGSELIRLLWAALAVVRPPANEPEPRPRALPASKGSKILGWSGATPLSRREFEILHLVAGGMSNKEIAASLGISDQTVKNNITSLLRKLGVQDRTQAVIYALRHGWIEVPRITG